MRRPPQLISGHMGRGTTRQVSQHHFVIASESNGW
jgi:hypothetical protein